MLTPSRTRPLSRFRRIQAIIAPIRNVWLIVGITLLLVLVMEGAVAVAWTIYVAQRQDRRAQAECYAQSPWARDYFRELGETRMTWQPYTYWRRKPYHGELIRVDDRGRRNTYSPTVEAPHRLPVIWVFGGSTVWGIGARDKATIPSLISEFMEKRGDPCHVVNMGEGGYVSTQGVVHLITLLQEGERPDLVLFYDGFNDTLAAFQSGTAGRTIHESHRAHEFNLTNPQRLRALTRTAACNILMHSHSATVATGLARRIGLPAGGLRTPESSPNDNTEALACDVIDVYFANVKIVTALAETHGFQASFYWQPTIFTKPNLSQFEESIRSESEELRPLYDAVYDEIETRLAEREEFAFRDLSAIFEQNAACVYVDYCHLGEAGNARVATSIVQDLPHWSDVR